MNKTILGIVFQKRKVSMDYTEISKNIRKDILETLEKRKSPCELSDKQIHLLDKFLRDTFLRERQPNVNVKYGVIHFKEDYQYNCILDDDLFFKMKYYQATIDFLISGGFKLMFYSVRGHKCIRVSL